MTSEPSATANATIVVKKFIVSENSYAERRDERNAALVFVGRASHATAHSRAARSAANTSSMHTSDDPPTAASVYSINSGMRVKPSCAARNAATATSFA